MGVLPPVTPAVYTLEPFWWCQVEFVFTHELLRNHKELDELKAYQEARDVAKSLKDSGKPLALGAEEGEINWETMICAASAYAHMGDEDRAQVRQAIRSGNQIWLIMTSLAEPDMCDRRVLEDPEYHPRPSCVPKEAISAGALAVSTMLGTLGLMFAIRAVGDRAD